MIFDAKQEFSRTDVMEFECEGYPVKIEVSENLDKIFYAGDGLGLIERRQGWLINEGIVHYNRSKLSSGLTCRDHDNKISKKWERHFQRSESRLGFVPDV